MALLAPEDQEHLRRSFSEMTRRVHLIFVTQTIGCETCTQTRRILDELPGLSDRIVIDEVNLVLEAERAATYGIDRAPAIAVAFEDTKTSPDDQPSTMKTDAEAPRLLDSRIRFLGAPAGYEFVSLVHAILIAGGRTTTLSELSRQRVASVTVPVTMQVFTTPT